jgi:hypothetical protein
VYGNNDFLCPLQVPTIYVENKQYYINNNLLCPLQVPTNCQERLNETGSVLMHVVADRLGRAGDSAPVEESLAVVASRMKSYWSSKRNRILTTAGEAGDLN